MVTVVFQISSNQTKVYDYVLVYDHSADCNGFYLSYFKHFKCLGSIWYLVDVTKQRVCSGFGDSWRHHHPWNKRVIEKTLFKRPTHQLMNLLSGLFVMFTICVFEVGIYKQTWFPKWIYIWNCFFCLPGLSSHLFNRSCYLHSHVLFTYGSLKGELTKEIKERASGIPSQGYLVTNLIDSS